MSKTTTCPSCGAQASGNFCASCGTALESRFCTQCGAKVTGSGRFCTQCGAEVGGAGGGGGGAGGRGKGGKGGGAGRKTAASTAPAKTPVRTGASASRDGGNANMGWWVAGAMMVVVILFMAWPIMNPSAGTDPAAPNAPFAGGGAGGAGTTDLSNMTPRQAADRLYNRVMAAAEQNDSAQVTMFLPMAIQAYDMARPLNLDGLFHLSRLQRTGRFDQDALATAQEALEQNPSHLLSLYAAADASLAMGDQAAARGFAEHLLEVWDAEMASGNVDYQDHANQMDGIREYAQEIVDGG